jgi:hypothetical protein
MRKRIFKLIALLILGIGLTSLHAQNTMNVYEREGIQTTYTLGSISKITFSEGNVIIGKSDGGIQSYGLNHIRYLSFVDLLTDIPLSETQGESNFTLYPNPAADQLQIHLETMENSIIQVDIIDIQGRIVLQQKIHNKESNCTATIHLLQLAKGLYLCRVQSGGRIETIKFIKNQ